MRTKTLPKETEQKIVITFLDRHRLAILYKLYLKGVITIFRFLRETSNGRL